MTTGKPEFVLTVLKVEPNFQTGGIAIEVEGWIVPATSNPDGLQGIVSAPPGSPNVWPVPVQARLEASEWSGGAFNLTKNSGPHGSNTSMTLYGANIEMAAAYGSNHRSVHAVVATPVFPLPLLGTRPTIIATFDDNYMADAWLKACQLRDTKGNVVTENVTVEVSPVGISEVDRQPGSNGALWGNVNYREGTRMRYFNSPSIVPARRYAEGGAYSFNDCVPHNPPPPVLQETKVAE